MSRRCTICDHAERTEIEMASTAGRPLRDIARRWRVSKDAVRRHEKHVPAALVEAAKTSERVANVMRAESVVEKIRALEDEARRLQAVAEAQGDTRAALVALRELRETLAAWSKLVPAGVVGGNLIASAEWAAMRRAILDALAPFPDARLAVAEAFRRREAFGPPEATSSIPAVALSEGRSLPPALDAVAVETADTFSAQAGKGEGA